MTKQPEYTCACCGQKHAQWPALGFSSPDNYATLPQHDKETIAEIGSDFCTIAYPDQVDRFIRCTLTQQVSDHCEDLEYGLWVSLSEKSYKDYADNYRNPSHEATYFGWLCNDIPGYEFNKSVPMTVFAQTGNRRPEIVPHQDFGHPFVKDYYNGIPKEEAERRIKAMLDRVG
jgi:hypothetical protein